MKNLLTQMSPLISQVMNIFYDGSAKSVSNRYLMDGFFAFVGLHGNAPSFVNIALNNVLGDQVGNQLAPANENGDFINRLARSFGAAGATALPVVDIGGQQPSGPTPVAPVVNNGASQTI